MNASGISVNPKTLGGKRRGMAGRAGDPVIRKESIRK